MAHLVAMCLWKHNDHYMPPRCSVLLPAPAGKQVKCKMYPNVYCDDLLSCNDIAPLHEILAAQWIVAVWHEVSSDIVVHVSGMCDTPSSFDEMEDKLLWDNSDKKDGETECDEFQCLGCHYTAYLFHIHVLMKRQERYG